MSESVYKVVDSRGRVHLPKEFRGKMDLDCGGDRQADGWRRRPAGEKKGPPIELGDKSPKAVEAFVHAAATAMSREKQMELAARLLELLRRRNLYERLPVPLPWLPCLKRVRGSNFSLEGQHAAKHRLQTGHRGGDPKGFLMECTYSLTVSSL